MALGRVRPRAILLDALGTLLALEDPSPSLVRELEARHGITVTTDEARSLNPYRWKSATGPSAVKERPLKSLRSWNVIPPPPEGGGGEAAEPPLALSGLTDEMLSFIWGSDS